MLVSKIIIIICFVFVIYAIIDRICTLIETISYYKHFKKISNESDDDNNEV